MEINFDRLIKAEYGSTYNCGKTWHVEGSEIFIFHELLTAWHEDFNDGLIEEQPPDKFDWNTWYYTHMERKGIRIIPL